METGQHLTIKQSACHAKGQSVKQLYDWKPRALCRSVFFNMPMNEGKQIFIIEGEPEYDDKELDQSIGKPSTRFHS